jgi:glycosyltransferase involved in cell wall biosynthesis
MKLIVVILAYNEAQNIEKVIKAIPSSIPGVDTIQTIVINDGSKDATAVIAQMAGATVISHSGNKGVGQSFQTGLIAALENNADILVNIDGDGQFLPEEIPLLIQPILENKADFVPANRFVDSNGMVKRPEYMSRIKFWGNKVMANLIGGLTRDKFDDVSCGFRAYSREAMLQLNLSGVFTYTQETFLDLSFKKLRIFPVPVTIRYFPDRKSRVAGNLFTYTLRTLNIILRTYRDFRPLRFFIYLGLPPFLLGISSSIFVMIFYFLNQQFTPYKAVAFAGIYLTTLGLLLFIVGFLADMFMHFKQNLDKLIYFEKRQLYDSKVIHDESKPD